jgi:hypothetical protein
MTLLMRYPALKFSMAQLVQLAIKLKNESANQIFPSTSSKDEEVKRILLHSISLLDGINEYDISNIPVIKSELMKAITLCNTSEKVKLKPLTQIQMISSMDRPSPAAFELAAFGSIDLTEHVRAGVSGINKAVQSLTTTTNIPSNHWLFSPKAPTRDH